MEIPVAKAKAKVNAEEVSLDSLDLHGRKGGEEVELHAVGRAEGVGVAKEGAKGLKENRKGLRTVKSTKIPRKIEPSALLFKHPLAGGIVFCPVADCLEQPDNNKINMKNDKICLERNF